jgi:predicted neuraminidase
MEAGSGTRVVISRDMILSSSAFGECHAPTIVETKDGELLVAFFAGTQEGRKDVAIWSSKGASGRWKAPQRIAWDDHAPCWNPVLFADGKGALWLFYKVGLNPETWTGAYRVSEDAGKGWSEPQYLRAGLLGPTKNKPITMSNGETICGSSVESYNSWICWAEVVGDEEWRRFGPIRHDRIAKGVIQPSLVEVSEGRVRAFMRSTQAIGRICFADSPDYGRTWSRANPTALPNPNSAIDAVNLGSGLIVLAYNHSTSARTPLTLALSRDGGTTWRRFLDLESGDGEFSYPSLIQSADGNIHVVYTWRRANIGHAVISMRELLSLASG